jgi:hypothetical protein
LERGEFAFLTWVGDPGYRIKQLPAVGVREIFYALVGGPPEHRLLFTAQGFD